MATTRTTKKSAPAKKAAPKYAIEDGDFEDALAELAKKKPLLDELTEEVKTLRATVTAAMVEREKEEAKSGKMKVTLSKGRVSSYIDEKKLKKRIGAKLWDKVTTRTLDTAKLQAFIKSREVSATDVAACTKESVGTPFITMRFTG